MAERGEHIPNRREEAETPAEADAEAQSREAAAVPVETPEERREREHRENIARLEARAREYLDAQKSARASAEPQDSVPAEKQPPLPTMADARREYEEHRGWRDNIHGLRLRLAGIEQPEDTMALVGWLERHLTDTERRYIRVPLKRKKSEMEKYRRLGYEIADDYGTQDTDKDALFVAAREIPHHVSRKDEKKLGELFGQAHDPVETIEQLRRFGFKIDAHIIRGQSDFEALRDYVSSPELMETLEVLERAGLRPGHPSYFHYRRDEWSSWFSPADAIRDLARDPEKHAQLNEENLARIARLKAAGLRISLNEHLENVLRIAGDEDATTLLTAMAKATNRETALYDHDSERLVKEAMVWEDAGLASSFASAVRAAPWVGRALFDDLGNRSYFDIPYEERENKRIENARELLASPIVQRMLEDHALAAFVEHAALLAGSPPSLKNAETCASLYQYPETIPVLQAFREMGISPPVQKRSYLSPDAAEAPAENMRDRFALMDLLEQPEAIRDICDPAFRDFVLHFKNDVAYEAARTSIFGYSGYPVSLRATPGPILKLFRDPLWREGMASGRAPELVKKFGVFQVDHADFYTTLLRTPNSLETLTALQEKFGLDVSHMLERAGSYFDTVAFSQACEDMDLNRDLFDERTVRFCEGMREKAEYRFHLHDISDLIDLSRDETIVEHADAIFDAMRRLSDAGFNPGDHAGYAAMGRFSVRHIPAMLEVVQHGLVEVLERFANQPNLHAFLWSHVAELARVAPEKREDYITLFLTIDASPSQEIQRLKDSLLAQLLATENPQEAYRRVEDIFVKNNLPAIGKIYKVFETLYPPRVMENSLAYGTKGSPVLTAANARRRYAIVYHDLLRSHVESGNRSLRQYIETLQEGEKILQKTEEQGMDALSDAEQKQLRFVLEKFHTLLVNATLGKNIETAHDAMTAEEHYRYLRDALGVAEGQRISERTGEMFLHPLGLRHLDEPLARMREVKQEAHERNIAAFQEGEAPVVQEGDLLKGVWSQYLPTILQNGSAAKEFLGAAATSDQTPFDTDVSMILPEDAAGGFAAAVARSMALGYGDVVLGVRDRGQFQHTESRKRQKYDSDRLELFATGGGRHYGVRTAFSSTQIDFVVATENLLQDRRAKEKLENIRYEIAQNGWYIPMYDAAGTALFTPDAYREYRKTFNGLDRFDGEPLETAVLDADDSLSQRLAEVWEQKRGDEAKLARVSDEVRRIVAEALGEMRIPMREEFDSSIIGVELLDIGSTGRNTNAPGSYDFDMTLTLDVADFPRAAEIARAVKEMMQITKDESHPEASGYYQLRAKGVSRIGDVALEQPVDIDIGFAKKSDLAVFGSHDAVREKLAWIRSNKGEGTYQQTVASIVYTKQLLNDGHAYKRVEHGGFGGIGVENWLLYHDGNMRDAFRSFRDAAYENGVRIPFDRFKEKYKILNPGMNLKHLNHDNYIENMQPQGYERMLAVIDAFLKK